MFPTRIQGFARRLCTQRAHQQLPASNGQAVQDPDQNEPVGLLQGRPARQKRAESHSDLASARPSTGPFGFNQCAARDHFLPANRIVNPFLPTGQFFLPQK